MDSKHVVYLGLLIAALTVAACSSKVTPEPRATLTPLPPTDTPMPTATAEVPAPAVSGGEVPMGFTEDGAPYHGDPDAPVTLVEFSDFQ